MCQASFDLVVYATAILEPAQNKPCLLTDELADKIGSQHYQRSDVLMSKSWHLAMMDRFLDKSKS